MIERDLYEQYRFHRPYFINYKGFQAFEENGDLYIIVPIPHVSEAELLEIKQMSDYLRFQKTERIAEFVPTTTEELIATVNGEQVVLFKIAQVHNTRSNIHRNKRNKVYTSEGEALATFHQKGRFIPYPPKTLSRVGQWRQLWGQRLDQLESWWGKQIQNRPKNRFEKIFFETFPYYLGLTENAIQYIADCEWDDHRKESQFGTICYVKYTPQLNQDSYLLPIEFVFDHPTRDVAEGIRYLSMQQRSQEQEISKFLKDYEKVTPLTFINIRQIYGRLLFPLPYFELIEKYYSAETDSIKERCATQFYEFINHAEDQESFLRDFYKTIELPVKKLQLPKLDWLYRVKI
ncbi:spore coat putative kinase YutH [Calidifontibacillus oryziterrae]|uniref:spore coat putative kinase YutH n=1 Tax=Calidifontibacillus oryziterrae TaxID=1191699 RepID=UPI0002D2667E|nr:spore coat protein YutH [Calidifontibacillus oryziterrae]